MFRRIIEKQMRVPAHIDYLSEIRDFITNLGDRHRLSDTIIKSFKLAIDEAATNVIRHAYRDVEEPGNLTLRATIRKESMTVCIIDQGKFFDPRNVKDPDLDRYVKMGKKGGLGVFLMRKIMDDVEYRATDEGNMLCLTKNRERAVGLLEAFMPESVRSIFQNVKTRFLVKASVLITAIVFAGSLVFWLKTPTDVLNEKLPLWQEMSGQIVQAFGEDRALLDGLVSEDAIALMNSQALLNSHVDESEIVELALVDGEGRIKAHSNFNKAFSHYDRPLNENFERLGEHLLLYKTRLDEDTSPIGIYDLSTPINFSGEETPTLVLHIRAAESRVNFLIAEKRSEILRIALNVFGVSSAAAFLLIYLAFKPMKKLVEFVRSGGETELDHGVELDTTSEAGEIAQAFSNIMVQFRESQKNLAEQERLQQEMQVAKEIQQTLLPHEFPKLEGYEIAGYYESAQLVGGDYYDFVEIDRDTLGVVVADVSGKGVPGSMVMTMIRQALRTEARGTKDAAAVLARLNDLVVGDIRKGMFVTLFYIIIDSKKRRLNFASAGHNPMILYRSSTNQTYYLNPRGFPIGLQLAEKDLFRKCIQSDTIQLVEGDLITLYTDGVTEAMNSQRELYGEERLLKTIRDGGMDGADSFSERLSQDVGAFTESQPQNDDITFVTIREKTNLQKEELRRAREVWKMYSEGMTIREACETAGLSTYTYYNKFKKAFERNGVENVAVDESVSLEARHLSVEEKSRMFDVIKEHPEFGPKRISAELNSERYGFTVISENKIYDELVRNRLNTRRLREGYVARKTGGGKKNKALKPPGNPMLTLDGRVIISDEIQALTAPKPKMLPLSTTDSAGGDESENLEQPSKKLLSAPQKNDVPEEENGTRNEAVSEFDDSESTEFKVEVIDEEESGENAALQDADEAKSIFALDDLIHSEIEKEFSEPVLEVDFAENDEEQLVENETGTTVQVIEETSMLVAGVEELLDEGSLDETRTFDGASPFGFGQQSEKSDSTLRNLQKLKAEGAVEDSANIASLSGMARRKAMIRREQDMNDGFRLYKENKFKEAIGVFEKVVADFPTYKKALRVLGNAYFRTNAYEKAIMTYQTIIAFDPIDSVSFENMATAYLKQSNPRKAVEALRALLDIDSSRDDIRVKIENISSKEAA